MTIDELKRAARVRALAARDACNPAVGTRLGELLLDRLPPPAGAVVSGFWPLSGEIDIRPFLTRLHRLGHAIALPETVSPGKALIFRQWHPGAAMVRERFGTYRPEGPAIVPDWLLVPLLAFDQQGRRLGYGGGFYDRTLAGLPGAIAVGCAFAAQMLDEVPVDAYDAPLHAVATEACVHLFERS